MLNEKQKNLVEENYNLIYKYAKDHKLDMEEFSGLLSIGLCKAALNYDSDKTKFSTFAYRCMGNEVSNYLRIADATNITMRSRRASIAICSIMKMLIKQFS